MYLQGIMNVKALWALEKKGHSPSSSSINTNHSHKKRIKEVLGSHWRLFQGALKRFHSRIWHHIMVMSLAGCCIKSGASEAFTPYQRLRRSRSASSTSSDADLSAAQRHHQAAPPPILLISPSSDPPSVGHLDGIAPHIPLNDSTSALNDAENTVVLKISILGDSETGKTSFMAKYVSVEKSEEYVETIGVASVEKVFRVQNVNIALSIWDLGGHWQCASMLPMVCRDAAAIFIMFDLTRRSTLQSVKEWFLQAREYNKSAIPVIIGTKYDRFVQMPQDIQVAIIRQARFYAQAMGASIFFSSVTHNINIHKIFKVVVAKLFDLPCNIARNLNLGEPIIDY